MGTLLIDIYLNLLISPPSKPFEITTFPEFDSFF